MATDQAVIPEKASRNERRVGGADFINLAELAQDALWRRRVIEWRSAYALWTAMAVAAGFYYINAPRPAKWVGIIQSIVFALTYVVAAWAHRKHLKSIFISNEVDLEWKHYYMDHATQRLGESVPDQKLKRPEDVLRSREAREDFFLHRKHKMSLLNTPWTITLAIAALSLLLVAAAGTEPARGPREDSALDKLVSILQVRPSGGLAASSEVAPPKTSNSGSSSDVTPSQVDKPAAAADVVPSRPQQQAPTTPAAPSSAGN